MTTAEPASIALDANGVRFAALSWSPDGDHDAPLALLLHGYPDTAWTWRHLGPALAARGWRAVAPFTRGYAPTGLAPDDRYRASDLADDAVALHAALGGDERAVLVGHDWGAVTAWAIAARGRQPFARIACMSVPPTPAILRPFRSPRTLPMGLRQLRMSWYMAYNQLPVEGTLDRAILALWRAWSPAYDGAEDAARALEALPDHAHRRAALRYYRNNLQGGAIEGFTTRPRHPALYLHGGADGCMQAALAGLYADDYPAGSVVEIVDGLGHFLHLEEPQRVNARILAWLDAA